MNLPLKWKYIIAVVILLVIISICIWQYIVLDTPPYPIEDKRLFGKGLVLTFSIVSFLVICFLGLEYRRRDVDVCVERFKKSIDDLTDKKANIDKIQKNIEDERVQILSSKLALDAEYDKIKNEQNVVSNSNDPNKTARLAELQKEESIMGNKYTEYNKIAKKHNEKIVNLDKYIAEYNDDGKKHEKYKAEWEYSKTHLNYNN